MIKAHVRHILVPDEQRCRELKERIDNGEDFATLAKRFSHCPSGHHGGDLGEFGAGRMVAQFDEVAFEGEVNKVHGPVRTQFGYHLIEVLSRGERKDSPVAALRKKCQASLRACQATLRSILTPERKSGPWG